MAPRQNSGTKLPAFTFIDLFAGIGGLRRGFDAIGGQCVFTSEWNSYAQLTYKSNFKCSHEVPGDITKIEARDTWGHGLLKGLNPMVTGKVI